MTYASYSHSKFSFNIAFIQILNSEFLNKDLKSKDILYLKYQ